MQELRLDLAGVSADASLLENVELLEAFDHTLLGRQLLLRLSWLDCCSAVTEALRGSR